VPTQRESTFSSSSWNHHKRCFTLGTVALSNPFLAIEKGPTHWFLLGLSIPALMGVAGLAALHGRFSSTNFSQGDFSYEIEMRERSPLLLLLFRIAYSYTLIIYSACAALGFTGSLISLAATVVLAIGSEIAFVYNEREDEAMEKEPRHMV
jgi:hypothetical protein